MRTLASVFVTNLGKYNEGELVGEWFDLPYENGKFKECLDRIGINEEYEEYFITDYESEIGIKVDEYTNIPELNKKLYEIDEQLDDDDFEKLKEMLGCGMFTGLDECLNLMNSYEYIKGMTAVQWEQNMIEECYFSLPEYKVFVNGWLSNYVTIDYEEMAKWDDNIIETENGILKLI